MRPREVSMTELSAVQRIHDLIRTERITAEQGAMLLDLRHRLRLARRPRWRKALSFLGRMLFG